MGLHISLDLFFKLNSSWCLLYSHIFRTSDSLATIHIIFISKPKVITTATNIIDNFIEIIYFIEIISLFLLRGLYQGATGSYA